MSNNKDEKEASKEVKKPASGLDWDAVNAAVKSGDSKTLEAVAKVIGACIKTPASTAQQASTAKKEGANGGGTGASMTKDEVLDPNKWVDWMNMTDTDDNIGWIDYVRDTIVPLYDLIPDGYKISKAQVESAWEEYMKEHTPGLVEYERDVYQGMREGCQ